MPPTPIIASSLMSISLILWVVAFVRTLDLINRHKRGEQNVLNPIDGMSLWGRFLSREGFGPDAESARRSILLTYAGAVGVFILGALLITLLPPAGAG